MFARLPEWRCLPHVMQEASCLLSGHRSTLHNVNVKLSHPKPFQLLCPCSQACRADRASGSEQKWSSVQCPQSPVWQRSSLTQHARFTVAGACWPGSNMICRQSSGCASFGLPSARFQRSTTRWQKPSTRRPPTSSCRLCTSWPHASPQVVLLAAQTHPFRCARVALPQTLYCHVVRCDIHKWHSQRLASLRHKGRLTDARGSLRSCPGNI